MDTEEWKTKPTDRFVLKWIKIHLSSRITPHLLGVKWLSPWMITLFAVFLGVAAGAVFALGMGWLAGCLAAVAQIFDGVDGQYARMTGKQTRGGAFWDSVLDRYTDGSMVLGLLVFVMRVPCNTPQWLLMAVGFFALVGSNLISYSTARAEALGLDMGKPTLASKGTRSTVMILCAWGSLFWPCLPLLGLTYLAFHTNGVVVGRLLKCNEVC